MYTNFENLLPKTASGDDFSNDWLLSVCNFYGSDINRELLETQLTILKRHAQESSMFGEAKTTSNFLLLEDR